MAGKGGHVAYRQTPDGTREWMAADERTGKGIWTKNRQEAWTGFDGLMDVLNACRFIAQNDETEYSYGAEPKGLTENEWTQKRPAPSRAGR